MMYRTSLQCLLLVLALWPVAVSGQIVVSEKSIPVVGDTLRQMVDNFPVALNPGEAGGDKVWDFSTLQGLFVLETVFNPVESVNIADNFSEANAVLSLSNGIKNYFRLDGRSVKEVGVTGSDPINFGIQLNGKYQPPLIGKSAPLRYGDVIDQKASLLFPLPVSQFPDTLFSDFPFKPDSVRLRMQVERLDEVDSWGLLLLKEQMFNVLRVKRTELSQPRIDVKSRFFPWIDISDLFGIGELDAQSSVTYFFYDEDSKEPIVTLNMDKEGNINRADYIYNNLTSEDLKTAVFEEKGLHVYPNPSYGLIALNFVNLDPGQYRVKVMNILGVTKWESTFLIDGHKRTKADLSHFEPGTYLYALLDENNNIIMTKRLVIIRP